MALGLLLGVAWISLLLDSCVFTEVQGAIYRQTHDKINLVNDFSDSLQLDEGEGELLSNKLSRIVNKEYKRSPAVQPLKLFSVNQNMVVKPHANVKIIVNGASRQWGSNVFEPITFPLQSGSQLVAQTQPILDYESHSTPLAVRGSRTPAFPSFGETRTSESLQYLPPSREGVDEPVTDSHHQAVDYNDKGPDFLHTASSYEGSDMAEVSPSYIPSQRQPSQQYQPEIPKPQSLSWSTPERFGHGNKIDMSLNPAFPNWLGFPTDAWFPKPYVTSRGFQPDFSYNHLAPRVNSLPKAPEPPRPLLPRKSFIIQSKNGYQRQRLLASKTTNTPDYKAPKGKYGKSVKVVRGVVQKDYFCKI